ncbi:MAG: ABC transporter permease [Bacteroidota bacterium]|nr:ABC transporter permease [Bacteroidota bacterium]
MNKIWLIIQREYLTRVRNRTFVITTLLVPLLFGLLIGGTTYLSIKDQIKKSTVAVQDNSGVFTNNLQNTDNVTFRFVPGVDSGNYAAKGYDALLYVPSFDAVKKDNYVIYSKDAINSSSKNDIKEKINEVIENKLLQDAGINKSQLDLIHQQSQTTTITTHTSIGNNTSDDKRDIAKLVGYVCGFLIYITMFIYGMMVMRGVMEEKTNRIAEVIVSSVKPFQLMAGKIIGIGAVGLTQFLIWVVLIIGVVNLLPLFMSSHTLHAVQQAQQHGGAMQGGGGMGLTNDEASNALSGINSITGNIQVGLLVGCFAFYFLGGYLFYAALFAAIGSVVEDVQSSQSLTLPITMPIIFSFFIMNMAVQNPNSSLAVWCSIIPFSSSMVMMARLAYGVPDVVPYWQLALSMLSLIGGFLFTTWLAGKIYRTGILLYGKKPSWAQMMKWAFRSA